MDTPFIINAADAPAHGRPGRATTVDFRSEDAPWPDAGVNIQIMQSGQPNCLYHSEPVQEDFWVLHGECTAVVDGEERPLRQWGFLHCPAGHRARLRRRRRRPLCSPDDRLAPPRSS